MSSSFEIDHEVKAVYRAAEAKARQHRCNYVSTEHLLLGLTYGRPPNQVMRVLEQHFNITPRKLRTRLLSAMVRPGNVYDPNRPVELTGNARTALHLASEEAVSNGYQEVDIGHLLLGLLQQETGLAGRTLRSMGVDLAHCRTALSQNEET